MRNDRATNIVRYPDSPDEAYKVFEVYRELTHQLLDMAHLAYKKEQRYKEIIQELRVQLAIARLP